MDDKIRELDQIAAAARKATTLAEYEEADRRFFAVDEKARRVWLAEQARTFR